MPIPRSFLSILVATLFAGVGVSQAAGPADHQQCYKIKDTAAKASYTADLSPSDAAYAESVGCTISVPAKMLCVDVVKSNVDPVPPGADAGESAQQSLCYKLKCPKDQPTVSVEDQFGSRMVTLKSSRYLCAPIPAVLPPGTCAVAGDCSPLANASVACVASTCVIGSCNAGFGNCNGMTFDGCEMDTTSDPSNCGNCGAVCSAPNSTPQCAASTCQVGTCNAGYSDCNGMPFDGCEVDTTSDPSNCGTCAAVCPIGMPNCVASACAP